MGKWDRRNIFAWLVFVILGGIWFAVPSSVFIRNISISVEGRTIRYVRETPFGDVTAEWQAEITLIDADGFECNSGGWNVATYQVAPGNTVTYDLTDWADPCLEAGPPFYLTTTRRVLLFGVIPLRQVVQRTEVEGERTPVTILVVPDHQ